MIKVVLTDEEINDFIGRFGVLRLLLPFSKPRKFVKKKNPTLEEYQISQILNNIYNKLFVYGINKNFKLMFMGSLFLIILSNLDRSISLNVIDIGPLFLAIFSGIFIFKIRELKISTILIQNYNGTVPLLKKIAAYDVFEAENILRNSGMTEDELKMIGYAQKSSQKLPSYPYLLVQGSSYICNKALSILEKEKHSISIKYQQNIFTALQYAGVKIT